MAYVASAQAVLALGLPSAVTRANTVVFTGAGDNINWSSAGNWTNNGSAGIAPSNNSPGDDLLFQQSTGTTIALGGNRIANSLAFVSPTSIFSSTSLGTNNTDVLTLTSGNVVLETSTLATVNAIVKTNVLTVSGAGELQLSNTQNNIGSIVIGDPSSPYFGNGPVPALFFNSSSALGTGQITLDAGFLWQRDNTFQTLSNPITTTDVNSSGILARNLAISGPITLQDVAFMSFQTDGGALGGIGNLTFTGNAPNAMNGRTLLSGLIIGLNKSAGVNALPGNQVEADGAVVLLQNDNQTVNSQDLLLITVNTSGSQPSVYPAIFNLSGHSTSIGSISGDSTSIVALGSGTLTVGGDSTPGSFAGSVTGNGTVIKVGGAMQELGLANTFTGKLNVSSGAIQLAAAATTGTPSSITVATGAAFDLNGASVAAGQVTIGGAGIGGSGALINSNLSGGIVSGPVALTSSTTFAGSGNITLTGTVSGSGGILQNGNNTLTLSSPASFTGGLAISAGTVVMAAGSTYSGGISISGGTVSVSADSGLGSNSNAISFSNNGTLQATASFSTGRSFTTTGGGINLVSGVTVTDSGTISGSGNFTQTGQGLLSLTSSSPFSGSLVLAGGTFSLAGTAGALPAISDIDLITTGILELNSSTALGGNQISQNRINDSAPVTLDGGTLSILGANGTLTTETLGSLIPHFGASTISLTNGSSGSVNLTFASLGGSSAGATISFNGSDLGNTEKVFFTSGVANGTVFGGGVTVNGTDFAKYSSTNGVIPFATTDYTINVFTPGTNVKLQPSVTMPPVPTSVGTVSIKTLNINADTAVVNVNQSTGTTLTLTNGGLIKSGPSTASITGGTLTTSSGELDISVQGGALNLSSALSGSFVLTKRGSGTLALTGNAASTYTGFTLVSGEMDLNKSAGAIAIPGNLIVNGGLLKSLASNQIAGSATVTLNYGTWDLNGQTESINQLNNINGTMLFHGGTLNVANAVNLSGGTTTVASILNSASLLTVSGGDNQVRPKGVVSTTALALLGSSPAVQLYSDPATPGRLNLPNGATLSYTGTGTALLTSVGNGVYPGVIDLGGANHFFTVSPSSTLLISAAVANGGFTAQGGGTVILTGSSSNLSSQGIGVLSGTTLLVNNPAALLGNSAELAGSQYFFHEVFNLNLSGGTLNLSSDLRNSPYSANISTAPSASATINLGTTTSGVAAGTFYVPQLNTYSGSSLTTGGAGTLYLQSVHLQTGSAGAWTIHNTANVTLGYVFNDGNVNIIKDQAGKLTLTGLVYNLTITGGTGVLNNPLGNGGNSTSSYVTVANGGVLLWAASHQFGDNFGALTINGATGASLANLNGFSDTLSALVFVAGGTLNTGSGTVTASDISYSGASGTAVINGNLDLGTNGDYISVDSKSSTAALQINANISGGSAYGILKSGTGTLLLAGTNSFTGPIEISAGAVQFASQPGKAQLLPSIILDGTSNAWTGKLDLRRGDYVLAGTSLTTITNQVKQGYSNGQWNGSGGLLSSTAAADSTHLSALGVIQNNQSGAALYTAARQFNGLTPAVDSILLKYTYYGDANLDGKVDGSDYSRIDTAYLADRANPTAATGWYNGDFNYDGVVNGSDYTIMDNAFNRQGAFISSLLADPQAVATDQTASVSPVPEPVGCGVLALIAPAILNIRLWRSKRPSFDSQSGLN
jgi:autotransporter-associated beta strand protein